ncbi:MAG: SDR family oxidoreductase [Planctomycetes bacterium]|nr:SDR family oxidoreductase [Planctomycetota bacterium]
MVDAEEQGARQRPVAIVTGGSRGIGLAIAEALARDGHRLVLVARDRGRLESTVDRLRTGGAEAVAAAVDLRAAGAADEVIATARQAFGPPSVVVSNAGTAPTAKIEATDDDMLRETFELHVGAPLALARAALPAMKAAGGGCLLHLASTAGLRGFPFTAAYTAAKHGMIGLARAFRVELARTGIRVYALCPGFVDSDITRSAAAAIAGRGRTSADDAFAMMAAQNVIGRMHSTAEVAAAAAMLVRERPDGCVYELDRPDPGFVDQA